MIWTDPEKSKTTNFQAKTWAMGVVQFRPYLYPDDLSNNENRAILVPQVIHMLLFTTNLLWKHPLDATMQGQVSILTSVLKIRVLNKAKLLYKRTAKRDNALSVVYNKQQQINVLSLAANIAQLLYHNLSRSSKSV